MSIVHDQAMNFIYQQVLERLLNHMSKTQRASLQLLIQRLLVVAGGPEYIGTFRLLLVQGGDRCSARLLAVMRAAQLSIALRAPVTFKLQVLTSCLPANSKAMLEQHERGFDALFMHDDPRVQVQMLEGAAVVPFARQPSGAGPRGQAAGQAMLLFGHVVDARPRALLGSRTYLELADAVRLALAGYPSVDAVVTALPARQRRRLLGWARRSLQLAGVAVDDALPHCLDELVERLGHLHGAGGSLEPMAHVSGRSTPRAIPLQVLGLDDLLPSLLCDAGLDRVMGWGFEPGAQAPSLAGFIDPLALAHLQDLASRCQAAACAPVSPASVPGGTSSAGSLYLVGDAKPPGLEPAQLACMFFRPFSDRGAGLERFLQCCHTDMLVALPYLHRALQGKACPDAVRDWIVNVSGLPLAQLRMIYDAPAQPSAARWLGYLAGRDVHLRLFDGP